MGDLPTLEAWLASVKLGDYAAAIAAEGYEELRFLCDADDEDLDELAKDVGMKKPHSKTFRKQLALLATREAGREPAIEPGPAAVLEQGNAGGGGAGAAMVAEPAADVFAYTTREYQPTSPRPVCIFSYASASDGGRGAEHMWAVGNVLEAHGISTYCGLMVRTDMWQVSWFGKLSTAKFAVVMLSDAYWKSGPCVEEVMKILQKGIKVRTAVYPGRARGGARRCLRWAQVLASAGLPMV